MKAPLRAEYPAAARHGFMFASYLHCFHTRKARNLTEKIVQTNKQWQRYPKMSRDGKIGEQN